MKLELEFTTKLSFTLFIAFLFSYHTEKSAFQVYIQGLTRSWGAHWAGQ